MDGQQRHEQPRQHPVDIAGGDVVEIGNGRARGKGRNDAADDVGGNAGRCQNDDEHVGQHMHRGGNTRLEGRDAGQFVRAPVGEDPPDNAEYGQRQYGQAQCDMGDQEGALCGIGIGVRRVEAQNDKRQDQQCGHPVNDDGDCSVAVGCALEAHDRTLWLSD